MKKIIYLILAITISCSTYNAQQIPLNSLYSYNNYMISPSEVGKIDQSKVNLSHRQQWLGFDGGMSTTWLDAQTQINPKMGIGLKLGYDKVSFLERLQIDGSFGYHLMLDDNSDIHFGLSLGVIQGAMNLNDIIATDYTDDIIVMQSFNDIAFNSQFGLSYTYDDKLNIGFSFPQIYSSDIEFENVEGAYNLNKHRYFYSSYEMDLSEGVIFTPMFLVRSVKGVEKQFDVFGNLNFNNKFWGGLGVRQEGGMIFNFGLRTLNNLNLTYAYEFNRNGVAAFSSGSHEILLSLTFGKDSPIEEEEEEENTQPLIEDEGSEEEGVE